MSIFLVVAMRPDQMIFDAERFARAAARQWPGCFLLEEDPARMVADVSANVQPSEGPPFSVSHFPDNRVVSVDGNPFNSAEVAVWVRNLHPDPDLVLWYIDESFSAHVDLFPGITADEIHAGWVDHREHDPYEEYPQYFPME